MSDTSPISCTGTRVANRASVAGTVPGWWRSGTLLGDEPPVRALTETKGSGPVRRRGKNTGGAREPRHVLN